MAFGNTPKDNSGIPLSSIYVPGTTGSNLTALQGGPATTDGNGQTSAPAAMHMADGADVTQGTSTDASTVASIMGRLTAIKALLSAPLSISGTITETNSAAILADLAAIETAIGSQSDSAWSGSGSGSEIAILKKLVSVLTSTLTVSGTVTANAGTNLSTASLALDATLARLTLAQSTALGTNTGALVQGSVTTSSPTYTTGNVNPLSLTPSGALRTDSSSTVQAVSQSGTWTVQPGNTPNTVAWKTDGSAVTQPVSGTVSVTALPGGANTIGNVGLVAGSALIGSVELTDSAGTNKAAISSGGALKTDGSGVIQPVSGSVSAAQSGTWNITNVSGTVSLPTGASTAAKQPAIGTAGTASSDVLSVQGIASMTPLKTDGSATTQPVSGTVGASQSGAWNVTNVSGTVSLPTGAATSAKQPSIGTAGTASTDVLSVQGVASMTPLKTDGSAVTQPVSGSVTANAGTGSFNNASVAATGVSVPASASYIAANKSGNLTGLTMDTGGNLNVNIAAGGSGGTSSSYGSAFPATGTAVGASDGTNMQALQVESATNKNLRVALYNGTTEASVTVGNALKVDASATTQPVSGTVTSNQGTANATPWNQNVAQVGGTALALGQAIMASSVPVVLASNQSTVPISGAVTGSGSFIVAQPTGSNLHATLDSGSTTAVTQATGSNLHTVVDSGSVTASSTQSGTWTVQPGNTANTTPWLSTINQGGNSASVTVANALKVDASATTQPVSGTVTANAGTNLNTSALALDTSVNGVIVAQGSATTGEKGPLVQGAVTTAAPTYTTAQTSPISLTTAGAVRTDSSATTQPVSGTVSANAAQSGTWNITNVSGTVSLPTGAATAAKQPAIGIAGTASVDVLSVQGVTSMTPLKVDGSGVTQPVSGSVTVSGTVTANGILVGQGSTTSGENGILTQGAVTSSAPTYTTAQTSPISLTTAGALRVDATGTTQPVSGTVSANASQTGTWNITNVSGTVSLPTGAATSAKQPALGTAGTPSSDVLSIQGVSSMTPLKTDGSATTQPVSGTVTANAGSGNFTVAQATGSNLHAVLDSGSTTIATQATASNLNAQVVGAVASAGSNAGNPIKTGGVYNSTQPTVTTGQVVDLQSTARGAQLVATGADTFNVAVNAALPAGTNVIGHVIADSGSTTVVTSLPSIPAGTNVIGHVIADSGSTTAVTSLPAIPTGANTIGAVTQASGPWTQNMTQVGGTNVVTGGASGLLAVGGPVASGSSNADNPLKVGGVFNTTQPTVTTGQVVDAQMTARGARIVASGVDPLNIVINSITAALSQANQIPVCPAGQQGLLTIAGTLTANADNSLTFSGNSTVARRIRIQNESAGTIYWNADATASTGSPSLASPASNTVMVEWITMAITTLHIWIPTGGTTALNATGGVKISAWA